MEVQSVITLILTVLTVAIISTLRVVSGLNLKNVALGKPALGDSMYTEVSISRPTHAVDGDTRTDVWYYTCFHSSDYWWIYNPHWWIVDLLQEFTIHEVKITNRNIYSSRLNNFTIDVFSGSQDPRSLAGWPTLHGTRCHHQQDALGSSETRTMACETPTKGRYLRVVKYGYESLVMCEVQVMADVSSFTSLNVPRLADKSISLAGSAVGARSAIECTARCARTSTCNIAQWKNADKSCTLVTYSPFTASDGICSLIQEESGSGLMVFGDQNTGSCTG